MIEKPKLTAGQAYANEVYKHLAVATKPLTKAEIDGRIKELEERRTPLINFIEKVR